MIASRSHKFIFIKTRKTGGTSLEIVLSSWCSGRDICSAISPADEALRAQYGGAPLNNLGRNGRERFDNHMPASLVRRRLPLLWHRAFRFTVERHPYEKVVSLAWFNLGQGQAESTAIGEAIEQVIESRLYLNHPLYTIGGRLAVAEVWDHGEAWDRLEVLARKLGTELPAERPRAKANFRKDRRPAREILTGAQQRRIFDDARFEFELMGYER